MNVWLKMVVDGIGCPTQGRGTVDGKPFYYRWRHGKWTFSVADTFEDAVRASWDGNGLFQRSGCSEEGAMLDEAEDIIRRCATEYHKGHNA